VRGAMPRAKDPFRGKRRGFATERAGKQKKLNKKKKKGGGEGKPRRSSWGLLGLLTSLAAGAVAVLGFQGQANKRKREEEAPLLTRMLMKPLEYTEHGACRMDCRFISKSEVLETLTSGRINNRKSMPNLLPCPKYVVDARVGEQGKNVQGVFSACPSVTRVVTVIDKDTNHPCPPC